MCGSNAVLGDGCRLLSNWCSLPVMPLRFLPCLQGPELINMYVGESERQIREASRRAVLFCAVLCHLGYRLLPLL